MVPLVELLKRKLKNEKIEKPTIRHGQAGQNKKGEDFTLMKLKCQKIPRDGSSTFAVLALHEAIMREDSTLFEEGIIIEEFRRGFIFGDKLLCPAMVKVSAGPGPAKAAEDCENAAEHSDKLAEECKETIKDANASDSSDVSEERELHGAIMREDSTLFEEGIIIEEFRRGFILGDKLLRPAMVKVSAGPGPAKAAEDCENAAEHSAKSAEECKETTKDANASDSSDVSEEKEA